MFFIPPPNDHMAASYNLFHDDVDDADADADTDDYCSYRQIIDMRPFFGISNTKYIPVNSPATNF